jgi:hypothetical protein
MPRTNPRNRPLTDQERTQIRDLANAGKTITEISRALGRSRHCVTDFIHLRGIEVKNGWGHISDIEVERMLELAELGYTGTAIARALGRPPATINKHARLMGISLRPPSRECSATVRFDPPEYYMLGQEAARRAMTVPGFLRAIIVAVMSPPTIVDAVLDVERDALIPS